MPEEEHRSGAPTEAAGRPCLRRVAEILYTGGWVGGGGGGYG